MMGQSVIPLVLILARDSHPASQSVVRIRNSNVAVSESLHPPYLSCDMPFESESKKLAASAAGLHLCALHLTKFQYLVES